MMMLKNIQRSRFFAVCLLFLFFIFDFHSHAATDVHKEESKSIIPIGVVLDLDSPMGSMADLCMTMAISDFYSAHPNYTTRLQLHTKNANSVLHANLAGSKNGGIDAIFDEIPYLKLFMNKYQFQYKMVGPTYRTSGFGCAFPIGSPLVTYFSRAILNVTQSPEMNIFERKNFGPGYSSQDPLSSVISQGTSSLCLHEFAGLFLIVGSLTLFALFCSETSIGRKLTGVIGHFIQNRFRSKTPQVHSVEGTSVGEDTTIHDAGDESHEFTQDNAPEEGGDAQLIEEISEQEGEEIEIGMNDEVITAPYDGLELKNLRARNY